MIIEVTAEDIAEGVAKDCWECPLARAISRAMGRRAKVGCCTAFVTGVLSACFLATILPDSARGFRYEFDEGRPVKPFSFELPTLDQWDDSGIAPVSAEYGSASVSG